jgi:hypothetical protein
VGAIDARDAEVQAAVKRGQVQADLFGTVRAIGRLAGVVAVALGALAVPVGYALLWIVAPNVVTGRWAVGIAGAVLALGGLGTAAAGLALALRARDVASLRRRMAAVARACVLLAVPGLLLLALLVAAAGRGATVQVAGWLALQVALAPLGLAAVLACCSGAAPRDRNPAPERRRPLGPATRGALAVAVLAALLPAVLPDGQGLWPHRPLPGEPLAAVAALDARSAWERGWRFRAARAFPWRAFVERGDATGVFATLDRVWVTPELVREAFAEVVQAAAEDGERRTLLCGLITDPTLPVRMRVRAIEESEALCPLPPEVEAALTELCIQPAVALDADMRNWNGHSPAPEGASDLVHCEDRIRQAAINALWHTRTRSPRVLQALESLRQHPRLDILVRRVLEDLAPPPPAPPSDDGAPPASGE